MHGGVRLSPARRPHEPAVPLRPRGAVARDSHAGGHQKGKYCHVILINEKKKKKCILHANHEALERLSDVSVSRDSASDTLK